MAIIYFVLGIIGGVLSGMGMGGGTLLIPLLTTILFISQKQAQFLNLFSFIIMSTFIIFINYKNKMIQFFPALIFSGLGTIFSILAALLVKNINDLVLKSIFGVFLIILAFIQVIAFIIKKKQKNR